MSRKTPADATETFRAVVMTHYPANEHRASYDSTSVYGPYATKGAAKAAVTRETTVGAWYRHKDITFTTKIQRSPLVWEDVES